MENEDYRIITLHDNKLKVYRDGRIEKAFGYTSASMKKKYKEELFIKIGHNSRSYTKIVLSYKRCEKHYQAHRIIAYAFLGLDIDNPTQIIDHIDRNKTNNNVVNLRIVTKQQNEWNNEAKGYWKKKNKYQALIKVSRKKIYLGTYKTEACARYAYLTAKSHYHQF